MRGARCLYSPSLKLSTVLKPLPFKGACCCSIHLCIRNDCRTEHKASALPTLPLIRSSLDLHRNMIILKGSDPANRAAHNLADRHISPKNVRRSCGNALMYTTMKDEVWLERRDPSLMWWTTMVVNSGCTSAHALMFSRQQ